MVDKKPIGPNAPRHKAANVQRPEQDDEILRQLIELVPQQMVIDLVRRVNPRDDLKLAKVVAEFISLALVREWFNILADAREQSQDVLQLTDGLLPRTDLPVDLNDLMTVLASWGDCEENEIRDILAQFTKTLKEKIKTEPHWVCRLPERCRLIEAEGMFLFIAE